LKSQLLRRRISEQRRRRNRKLSLYFAVFSIISASVAGYYFFWNDGRKSSDNNLINTVTETIMPEEPIKKDFINDDKIAELNNVLVKYPEYTTAIHIINTEDGEEYHVGSDETYTAASTTKVISGICYLRRVEAGYTKLSSPLGSSTGEFQLQQMINRSNNISWDLINGKIGYSNLQTCARGIGVSSYKFSNNTVLPAEMAKVLYALSNYQLLSKANTDLLLSYMQDTNEERMIPANLPGGYTVNHKYGIYAGNLHDIGVIQGSGGKYALAIYTKGPGLGEAELAKRLIFYKEILGIILKEV
jgi:beta-lactamase class A